MTEEKLSRFEPTLRFFSYLVTIVAGIIAGIYILRADIVHIKSDYDKFQEWKTNHNQDHILIEKKLSEIEANSISTHENTVLILNKMVD